jgi:hypothetical protein
VPQKQPKRGRLWLNDGSCVRRRPQHQHHVWSYDFVLDRTHDGPAFRMLTVIGEYSRECLAIRTERRQNQETVLETLADLFLLMASSTRRADLVYRAGQPLGERLQRELQRQAMRRTA